MAFPADLEKYIKETVDYAVGLPVSENTLRAKLAKAEAAEALLKQKVFSLTQRLKETQEKLDRSKGESNLNAQALKKYVLENQKITEQYNNVCKECSRLDRECALFLHDREVCMEAADEAEERANHLQRQFEQANERIHELVTHIEDLNQRMTKYMAANQQMGEELNCLRSRVKELEFLNESLQNKNKVVENCEGCETKTCRVEQLERENKRLREYLDIKDSDIENHFIDRKVRRTDNGAYSKDRISLVTSVVAEVLSKATEQEKEEAISRIQSGIETCIGEVESEFLGRLETSEKTVQLLKSEVQSLTKEKNKMKINLETAEQEVQLLDEQNKDLREVLRGKFQSPDGYASPHQIKVKSSCSPSLNKQIRSAKAASVHGNDMVREPLTPLAQNPVESRVHHR